MIRNIHKIITIMVLLSISLYGYGQASDSITVAGHVFNITDGMPHTLIINECDISNKSAREICELGEDGLFVKKIPLSFPHTFTVNFNRHFINAFAAPGDSVHMDIDASTSPLSVTFSGDNADLNQQYDQAHQHLSSLFYSRRLPNDTTPFGTYMPVFKKNVEYARDSIDSYAKKHNLSNEVLSMLYTESIYSLANDALGYQGRNMEDERAFYLDPIFDLFNEDNTKVMIYPYHLSAIMNRFPDVRDSAKKGIIRDIMYACDETVEVPDRDVFYNQKYYDRLYPNAEPVKEISIEDIQNGKITIFYDGVIKEMSDENPLTWLLNEFKGHPIYLDVSATWCGPCRYGLIHSESLRSHFKDSSIKFAVIWSQSSKTEWLKFAPAITNAVQIFIEDQEMMDRLAATLKFKGFPTPYMIDKNGNIIKEEVPDFHSSNLPDFLNRYR